MKETTVITQELRLPWKATPCASGPVTFQNRIRENVADVDSPAVAALLMAAPAMLDMLRELHSKIAYTDPRKPDQRQAIVLTNDEVMRLEAILDSMGGPNP